MSTITSWYVHPVQGPVVTMRLGVLLATMVCITMPVS